MPIRRHPCWCPQFKAHIVEDKEKAISSTRTQVDDTQIYSGGSGFKGTVGAAAVIPETGQKLQFRLGKISHHMVFKGELVGILLVLQ